jgi:hypothetical protein
VAAEIAAMSDDENVLLIMMIIIGLVRWWGWYLGIFAADRWTADRQRRPRVLLATTPLAAGLLLGIILRTLAADDVRYDMRYLSFYFVMGIFWIGSFNSVPSWFGMEFRQDVLARANHSAAWLYAGWVVGLTLAFAGGNIGNGPGWYVVLYSAALATISLIGLGSLLTLFTSSLDAILIDRDLATGVRIGGLFVAWGTILGTAVAGDWVSMAATNRDFLRSAWVALLFLPLAWLCHGLFRPTPEIPRPSVLLAGWMPVLLFWGLTALWFIFHIGARLAGT